MKNLDGYELYLTDLLHAKFGKDISPCLSISFHRTDKKDVCRIIVLSSLRPVYLKEGKDEVLYVRTGNSTRKLSMREAVDYVRTRWK